MSKKIIYLATPYSHENSEVREIRAQQVTELASILIQSDIIVFSPITYGHELAKHGNLPTDFKFWENFCITFLTKCDTMCVYKMSGWDISKGVKSEIEFCEKNNITIKYIEFNKDYHKKIISE